MNKKIAFTVLFLSLLCLTTVGSAFAQAIGSIGVKQGDMFKYSLVVNWSSTNPNETVPANLYVENQTEYFQINILLVTTTTVQTQTITHYTNGEETNDTESSLVSMGIGNLYVYSANLSKGSYLFPGNTSLPWVVNETVPRYYQDSGFRQTNHMSVNRTDLGAIGEVYGFMDLYFDQATGIVVESTYTFAPTATPQQTISRHLKLTESSVWVISPSPTTSSSPSESSSPLTSTSPTPTQEGTTPLPIDPLIIVLVLVVVIVVVVVVLLMRRGKKRQEQPPKQPLTQPPTEAPSTPAPSAPAKPAAQAKRVCGKCGHANPRGSEFCNKCGAKLQD